MGTETISGNGFLVYGSVSLMDIYVSASVDTATYDAATSLAKQKAIITATRWLNSIGLCDANGADLSPSDADTDVPVQVLEGTYELAKLLVASPGLYSKASTDQNLRSVKAGSVEVVFMKPQENVTPIPIIVFRILSAFLKSNQISSGYGMEVSGQGTDSCSGFGDQHGLSEGW